MSEATAEHHKAREKNKKTKKLCLRSSAYIYQWILIYLHTNVEYYNVSSKIDFQDAGLKVKGSGSLWLFLEKTLLWL